MGHCGCSLRGILFLFSSNLLSFCSVYVTKACPYKFDPLKAHFCKVKLRFTGYTLFFLFLLNNIDCGYSLEPHTKCMNEIICEKIQIISNTMEVMAYTIFLLQRIYNHITKKVRVVRLARDTPTCPPLHSYQILSKDDIILWSPQRCYFCPKQRIWVLVRTASSRCL